MPRLPGVEMGKSRGTRASAATGGAFDAVVSEPDEERPLGRTCTRSFGRCRLTSTRFSREEFDSNEFAA
jgi:hypothetical protein